MKLYVIQNSGVEHNELLGFYLSRELAEKDMDFIAKHDVTNSRTWQERWIKIGKEWYEQHRSKRYKKKWPKWDSPRRTKKSGWIHGCMYVAEYDVQERSLDDQIRDARKWQSDSSTRLMCSEDASHPKLKPYYCTFPIKGIGFKCVHKDCNFRLEPNNPILGIMYATLLGNRTQAAEARRLRSVRKA